MTEHKRRLDTHEAIVYAPPEGPASDTSTAQAVRALAERVETELAALKESFSQQDDTMESLRQSCSEANDRLDAWDKYLDATELSARDNTEAKVRSSVHLETAMRRLHRTCLGLLVKRWVD